MYLSNEKRHLLHCLEQYGALREDQMAHLLRSAYPKADLDRTCVPLEHERVLYRENGFIRLDRQHIDEVRLVAMDVLFEIQPRGPYQIIAGSPPFVLTFFKDRNNRLWRYDLCNVTYGTESFITAQLANIRGNYRTVIFLLEKQEQQNGLTAPCECVFVVRNNGQYQFYK